MEGRCAESEEYGKAEKAEKAKKAKKADKPSTTRVTMYFINVDK
jgi:hypothetical protein